MATVARIDDEVNIEHNSGYEYKWVVQKVDVVMHQQAMERDEAAIAAWKRAERVEHRNRLVRHLTEAHPGAVEAIRKALASTEGAEG